MVRAAKGMGGDLSALMPEGVFNTSWDMLVATNHAIMVLSWFENLPQDEQPPRHIWWSSRLIDEWFKKVREDRDKTSGSKRSSYDKSDDVPMDTNDFAKDLRPDGI